MIVFANITHMIKYSHCSSWNVFSSIIHWIFNHKFFRVKSCCSMPTSIENSWLRRKDRYHFAQSLFKDLSRTNLSNGRSKKNDSTQKFGISQRKLKADHSSHTCPWNEHFWRTLKSFQNKFNESVGLIHQIVNRFVITGLVWLGLTRIDEIQTVDVYFDLIWYYFRQQSSIMTVIVHSMEIEKDIQGLKGFLNEIVVESMIIKIEISLVGEHDSFNFWDITVWIKLNFGHLFVISFSFTLAHRKKEFFIV